MDLATLVNLVEEANIRREDILLGRGRSYAGHDEMLGNFKRVAQICAILGVDVATPHGACIYMEVQKLDRTCNMLFRQGVMYREAEEIHQDNLDDRRNYIDLLEGLLVDPITREEQ